ncbi:hypothetical protein TVAG_239170 [Trichomonas vaginalis G3]|uniref:CC2D2A N-terminal C2 domain-containing protein n=1 Tax=Trichomonas vaginalis (strain ATCC PRA-98 / G3) TaxID=412133 RepID=A2DGE8_TRIV3|nr:centrosomal protein-related family [Trichomonas vaginalis G3]EAY20544.1 hypothetical protein TVAG_239170 [Trichomonas vaginalis G3]KAI5488264.1 centrosomal protein-related family [Trichomonas vaginalis G3]|eukprot:XP_001581530.1 hypothetical protein [Trichomonas vaginalis G3]
MSDLEEKVRNYAKQLDEIKSQSCKPSETEDYEKQIEKLVNTIEKASYQSEIYEETEVFKIDDEMINGFIDSNFRKLTTSTEAAVNDVKELDQSKILLTALASSELKTDSPLNNSSQFQDDGVFVNTNMLVKDENAQRVKNRLKRTPKDRVFLDEQSNLKLDPLFIRQTPPQLNYKYKKGDYIENVPYYSVDEIHTSFYPAFFWDPTNVSVNDILRVEIKNIKYDVHALSSDQFYYSKKLESLYNAYMQHSNESLIAFYKSRIKILRHSLKENPDNKVEILSDIINCREEIDKEEQKLQSYKDQLTVIWQNLQQLRSNSFVETPIALKWYSKKYSEEDKTKLQKKQEKTFKKRINEIIEYNYLISGEKLEEKQLYNDLMKHRKQLGLPNAGDTEWNPKLTTVETTEDSKIPNSEVQRLNQASETYNYVKIIVGGQQAISMASSLDSDFTSQVNFGAKFIITRIPKYINIEIWEQSKNGVFKVCDTTLPVFNGEPAKYYENHFTSDTPLSNGKLVEGNILGAAFICVNPNASITRIRQNKPHQKAEKQISVSGIPGRQRTFACSAVSEEHCDPNDPQIIEALSFNADPNDNKDRDMMRFKLDNKKNDTLLASMAPTIVFKNPIDIREKKKEEKEENKICYDEIVSEIKSESPFSILKKIWNFLFMKRRPLFTYEQEREATEEPQTLFVRISALMNCPKRTEMCLIDKELNSQGYYSENGKKPRISMIAICEDQVYESTPMKTVADRWDCEFEIDVSKCPNFYLSNLTLNFFDNVEYQFPQLGNKKESHYIGQLEIPLSSIIENKCNLNGTFSINTPMTNLTNSNDKLMRVQMSCSINKNNLFKDTKDDDTMLDSNGIPLCDYLYKISLPEHEKDVTSILRFVSMFPVSQKDQGIVFNAQEIIDNSLGSSLELCILLSCYLLTLNYNPCIILCNDIIRGENAYVFVEIDGSKYYMDPTKNKRYLYCPFYRVNAIIDKDGVYLPLTSVYNPDYHDQVYWKKVRTAKSKQQEEIEIKYAEPECDTEELSKAIFKAVRSTAKKYSARKIKWNRSVSLNLEKIIDACENQLQTGTISNDVSFYCEASAIRAIGAPFVHYYFMRDNDLDNFIDIVCATLENQHFYSIEGDNIISGLSVKVFPHENGIYAVWVFLASVHKLSND